MDKVLAHIVLYRDLSYLPKVLESLQRSHGDFELTIEVTLNGMLEEGESLSRLRKLCGDSNVTLYENSENLGFCGAHNQAAARTLEGDYSHLLIVNPDLALTNDSLSLLLRQSKSYPRAAFFLPLLIRCDESLKPLEPEVIDSAGIQFTNTLRHFDRFGGEVLSKHSFKEIEEVSGGSGACLLFPRWGLEALSYYGEENQSLFHVFPQLEVGYGERLQLFDEGFFAYREDAELSLRAKRKGLPMYLVSQALGYHVRRVTPERRSQLSQDINRHSVRNRFLLQALHFSPFLQPGAIIPGFLFRNLVVVLGVFLKERSSFQGLREFFILFGRALGRRRRFFSSNAQHRGKSAGVV